MIETDGDGFLTDPNQWNEDVMRQLALKDGMELTDEHIKYILSARKMFDEDGMVPRIREFGKVHGFGRKAKELYDLFETGPMKRIAKYGGLPKPTGCV